MTKVIAARIEKELALEAQKKNLDLSYLLKAIVLDVLQANSCPCCGQSLKKVKERKEK